MFLYTAKLFHDQCRTPLHPRSCGAQGMGGGLAWSGAVSTRAWWLVSEMLQNLGQNRNCDACVWVLSNLVLCTKSVYPWAIMFYQSVSVKSLINSSQSVKSNISQPSQELDTSTDDVLDLIRRNTDLQTLMMKSSDSGFLTITNS